MNTQDLLKAPLNEAINSMNARVKSLPMDPKPRIFLAELLCLAGLLERADQQLEISAKVDPSLKAWCAAFRQLLRAEQNRREVFEQGRVPEFVGQPGPVLTAHLRAIIAWREGQSKVAAEQLAIAEAQWLPREGWCGGDRFDDLRDLNDLTSHLLEVLTGAGRYFWIGLDQVEKVQFLPPQRTRDLIWRRASVSIRQGPEGEVFIPALYLGSHAEKNRDTIRTGKATDWIEHDGGLVSGLGQRSFLIAENDRAILSLETLNFDALPELSHDPADG